MSLSLHPDRHEEIASVAAELNARMADLARHLLGEPNRSLSTAVQLRYGNKGSLAVDIAGDKAGKWFDHENGVGGDGLELVCHKLNLSNGEACEWAKQWLRISLSKNKPVKVTDILKGCIPISDTPAEHYLRQRGITAALPDCLRFRANAFGKFGALVALSTGDDGDVLAVQQTYLTDDGKKAPVTIVKRTNKAVEKWAEKSAVRLPGIPPVILTEGVENALSVWQATGQETWACLGISNIGHAPLPEGASVIVARDGDLPGSKASGQIKRAVEKLEQRGFTVSVAMPEQGTDFNDLLLSVGEEAVRDLIRKSKPRLRFCDQARTVLIGSDVEISTLIRDDLQEKYGQVIHAEGQFWRYGKTHWEIIEEHELRLLAHAYDGALYETPKGEPSRVKLGKGRLDSILNELKTLVTEPKFFVEAPVGINCNTGFIQFTSEGQPQLHPHSADHRCRHILAGKWSPDEQPRQSANHLLSRLLHGVFQGDDDAFEKTHVLAEVCGSAALGYATKLIQPRAVILKGERAENGKSQILDLARGLLPETAVSSVTAARMGDERHVIGLIGKLLNASDEVSPAAISSEIFKRVVTGEPVDGRDVYKSRIEFRSIAQHIFAANLLPPFQGGMDRGVQRRLLVITFNRTIPLEERIEAIGRRVAAEEADLLLAWAIEGASRLIRQRNFTIPPSSKVALADWIFGADPVLAWLDECVEAKPHHDGYPCMTTRDAFNQFHAWAVGEGFKTDKLPAINGFVQRVQANTLGITYKRTGSGRMFLGMTLKHAVSASTPSYGHWRRDAGMTQ